VRVYREAIDVLRDLGARVDEAPFPLDFDEMMVQNGRIIAAEAYALHRGYIEDPTLEIDPWVKRRVLAGKTISAADYIDMLAQRRRLSAEFARWMSDRDALLTPTLPDHGDAARGGRRGDDTARDVDPQRQLRRRLRDLAAGGILVRPVADRYPADRRRVRRRVCSCGSDERSRAPPTGTCDGRLRPEGIPRSRGNARRCRS
jgi:hypothetical protein